MGKAVTTPQHPNRRRRAIIFRSLALCVWRVDPAPNDPGLLAAKGAGSLGGGRALMRTLRQGFPPQCLIGVDRPRCKWLNLNFTSGRIPRVPRQARGCQGSPWSAIRPENISTQIKPAGSVQPAGFSFQHTKRMLPWNRNLGSGVSLIVAEFHTGKWTLWGAYWQDGARAIRIPAEMPH